MWWTNDSTLPGFILVGFSDQPQLELVLFGVILFLYVMTLLGNATIILVSLLDSKLHTPMYFFLSHLSFLDLCFTSSIIPQLLVNLGGSDKSITYGGCVVQLYVSLALGSTECVLLAVMSYDRYIAICCPLHYAFAMRPGLCHSLASVAWLSGVATTLVQSTLTLQLPFCGHRQVDHFFCEVPVLIKLACVDTTFNQAELFVASVLFLVVPLSLILISYWHIALAVLKIKSAIGRHKALGTCSSHLMVVIIFYGTIIFMYLQPAKSRSKDQGKFVSLFYTVVTPILNPLIYTLRNKEVKEALRKLLRFIHKSTRIE
ncbi:olfactory receptor 2G2-like isoform X1 [Callorhinus ursinus]|uniref:Olfactory receptor n=2 Tax=Otariidae TaxID=9702 RepID=A0A3Q7N3V3_CALUR|nr:olfactory receptor 2G2-like isoform X1 [Callorhinus ursinus]XP_027480184.1 olfactory receptor 2G2-like isoform X1 [Zalophus californianus]